MKKTFLIVFALALFVTAQAFALDLAGARTAGLVGEKLDGYVAVVTAGSGVPELVNQVNARRKAEYAKIAAQNGQPVDVVAKLAAQQVIAGLPSGAYYQTSSGSWAKK